MSNIEDVEVYRSDTSQEADGEADLCCAMALLFFQDPKYSGQENRLDKAMICIEKALAETSMNSSQRSTYLCYRGIIRLERNLDGDFDDGIRDLQEAILNTSKSNPNHQEYLDLFSSELRKRFDETENFDYLQRLIDFTIDDDANNPDDAIWLSDFSLELKRLYEQDGKRFKLDASIRIAQYAVKTDSSASALIDALNALSVLLKIRYEITSNHGDLAAAIESVKRALPLSPRPGKDRALTLSNLAIYLRLEYSCSGNIWDLHDAVTAARDSVEAAEGIDSRSHIYCLASLSSALEKRHDVLGETNDLVEALEKSRLAAQQAANDMAEYTFVFNNLGGLLEVMYLRTGKIVYLKESIDITQQAVGSLSEMHVNRALLLDNLATRLGRQYQSTGQSELLEESISSSTLAVKLTAPSSIYLAERLSNLGFKLMLRHIRAPNISDLNRAIKITNDALSAVPRGRSNYFSFRNNLANLLQYKFRFMKDEKFLNQAITISTELVEELEKISAKSPGLTVKRHNLAVRLGERFNLQKNEKDIKEAVKILESLTDSLQEDDQYFSICLKSLGNAYRKQSNIALDPLALTDKALQCFIQSSTSSQAVPLVRIKATRQAISILHQRKGWEQANELADKALGLLSAVCGRYLRREDQVQAMSQVSGLAADACSLALRIGKVDKALEYLELGRGVIAGYILDSRTELDDLRKDHSDLARSYEEESFKASSGIDLGAATTKILSAREKNAATQRLEAVVSEIQKIPKYKRFLKGPTIDELKNKATDSPIVVVNVTDIGSDAIILTKAGVKALSLPKLSSKSAPASFQQQFSKYASNRADEENRDIPGEDDPADKNDNLPEKLSWLWSTCVEPILDELDSMGLSLSSSTNNPLRVWWLGSGVASSFPFHVARDKLGNPQQDALHRVVSSYCSTIRALQHSQVSASSKTVIESNPISVSVVTMPTTPGHRSLPGVEKEYSVIEAICKGVYSVEQVESPTADKVLEAVPKAEIMHFACHGSSDRADPLNSHLLLQKQVNNKIIVDRLSVSKISQVAAAGRARMAYLSACSTAETKDDRLSDEGLHITGAFQMAGFAHVIGSLWKADDSICVKVAEAFYSSLTCEGIRGTFSDEQVPRALRDAVLSIQAQYPGDPSLWAQFVHFGI